MAGGFDPPDVVARLLTRPRGRRRPRPARRRRRRPGGHPRREVPGEGLDARPARPGGGDRSRRPSSRPPRPPPPTSAAPATSRATSSSPRRRTPPRSPWPPSWRTDTPIRLRIHASFLAGARRRIGSAGGLWMSAARRSSDGAASTHARAADTDSSADPSLAEVQTADESRAARWPWSESLVERSRACSAGSSCRQRDGPAGRSSTRWTSAAGSGRHPEWSCCTPVGSTRKRRTGSASCTPVTAPCSRTSPPPGAPACAGRARRHRRDDARGRRRCCRCRGTCSTRRDGRTNAGSSRSRGPPRLPIEHAALLAAERDHNVRRAIGLLAACVQQGLTTPSGSVGRSPDPQAAPRQDLRGWSSTTSPAGRSRSPSSTSGRLCAEYGLLPPDAAGRTARQGGPPPLPRLRVGPGRTGASSCWRWTARSTPRSSPGGRT